MLHPVLQAVDLVHQAREVRLSLALHCQDFLLEPVNLLFLLLLLSSHFQYLLHLFLVDLHQPVRGELLLWAVLRLLRKRLEVVCVCVAWRLGLVEDCEPVKQARIALEGLGVLLVNNHPVPVCIYLLEYLVNSVLIHPDMAVDQGTPMGDDFAEVGTEFIEVNVPGLLNVHEGKTELVLFVLIAVAEYVHDTCELIACQLPVLVFVEYIEDPVCEERVLALPKEAHLLPELLNVHHRLGPFVCLPVLARLRHLYLFRSLLEVILQVG